ncbi:transcription-repair coupling factor [Gemmatimonas sp.]|uniref:transcription-repair coupling factor n=1 Tax=Gemmatimonas sp. TaxID=1962908 RepID=UPI0039838C4A
MGLPRLLDAIEKLPAFARVHKAIPGPGQSLRVGGLAGSADAVFVAALARALPQRLVVVITDQVGDAERWLADLQSLVDDIPVALYPPREGFGEVEPHAEVAGERVETLEKLGRSGVRLLLTTARAVLEQTALPRALAGARLELRKGDVRRLEDLTAHLDSIGFERVPMVEDVAQFSVRGGIIDIYSFGMAEPVRLEFWGDDIVELRHFDLNTQRSTRDAELALILPVDGRVRDDDGEAERVSLPSLWPPDAIVVMPAGTSVLPELVRTWDEAAHHLELARRRGEEWVRREQLFVPPPEMASTLARFGTIRIAPPPQRAVSASLADLQPQGPEPDIAFATRPPEPISRDLRVLRKLQRDGLHTLILCDNAGQVERLDELLGEDGPLSASLAIGVLGGGFIIPNVVRVLTDHEIFRRDRRLRRTRKYSTGAPLDTIGALKPGDYVVHLEHGIGIYRGIEKIFVRESTIEAAVIEYEGGDRLNVPLYRIDQIERYRSASDVSDDAPAPRLHKLGGNRWKQQREKTRMAILEMTQELLDLYARRKVATRPTHGVDTAWQRQLESSFLFEDTPDQRKATEDVKRDLESDRPMDRLLVGDVGYGKTEIAIRAAFKAVQGGRQVAVLVPTTILAEQHARSFGDRLADFPVTVEVMSRFQTAKEQAVVVEKLKKKQIDIVIGTHRLLSPDVEFADLGLIVVDEEHRFGVKHKERLKQLKLQTDVLTLTATPIPRTLHQSLAGLRDLTLMQTPPRDRSPVLTFVEPFDDALIEEAVSRELDRGGQVFFVHNRIETIEAIADHLRRIVPRAKVAVGHGQMKERALEAVMRQFVDHEVDILVSTLIVESGLDVPNANTMFVNRADHLGLAQLYQLRGRVGRSHRRAYCYLLVPDRVDEDAERRLAVLEHHTELGAGYRIALKDLELRGAGNLLGSEQSGFVHSVGFDLYLRLLDETVRQLSDAGGQKSWIPADVSLDFPSFLPDDYITSQEAKLDVYRRLTALREPKDIEALQLEVRDRFGPMPSAAHALFASAMLRVLGAALGVEGVLVRASEARVSFRADAVPRLKGLSAAFHGVQFQVDVRRTQPLALKLTRLGGAEMLEGLVRALRALAP